MAHVRPIILPAIALVSILWTVWDPTYASFRRAQIQGRDVRIQGKHSYIVSMHICNLRPALLTFIRFSSCFHGLRGWSLLLFSPCLIQDLTRTISIYYIIHHHLEVGFIFLYCLLLNYPSVLFLFACHKLGLNHVKIFFCSCVVLRLQQPPSIRLLDTTTNKFPPDPAFTPSPSTNTRSSPAPRPATEPDLLAALSLSSTPIVNTAPNPVFGFPSLHSPTFSKSSPSILGPANDRMDEDMTTQDSDVMDWTPTDPLSLSELISRRNSIKKDDEGSWLRRQRFFPPEQPTGLEGLFARTLLVDDDNQFAGQRGKSPRGRSSLDWSWAAALLLVPLLGVAYWFWWR
jgi:hypothetical protein